MNRINQCHLRGSWREMGSAVSATRKLLLACARFAKDSGGKKTPVLHLGMDVGCLFGSDCWHQADTQPEEVPAPGGGGVETTS